MKYLETDEGWGNFLITFSLAVPVFFTMFKIVPNWMGLLLLPSLCYGIYYRFFKKRSKK